MWEMAGVGMQGLALFKISLSLVSVNQGQVTVPGIQMDSLLPKKAVCHSVVTTIKAACLPQNAMLPRES